MSLIAVADFAWRGTGPAEPFVLDRLSLAPDAIERAFGGRRASSAMVAARRGERGGDQVQARRPGSRPRGRFVAPPSRLWLDTIADIRMANHVSSCATTTVGPREGGEGILEIVCEAAVC